MRQYEPDRLSPAQVAAMRRSLTSGRAALTRRSLLRAAPRAGRAAAGERRGARATPPPPAAPHEPRA
ncbi:spermidine/putrescine ABC transporter substrate-binding protein, partial [Streptomyces sp. NPDC058834]